MALISYPDLRGLDPAIREAIESFEATHRRPSILQRILAHFPPVLPAFSALHQAWSGKGSLDRKLKELIFVTASSARGCFY